MCHNDGVHDDDTLRPIVWSHGARRERSTVPVGALPPVFDGRDLMARTRVAWLEARLRGDVRCLTVAGTVFLVGLFGAFVSGRDAADLVDAMFVLVPVAALAGVGADHLGERLRSRRH